MVLEGVHIVPGMITIDRADALVVQCVVAISDEDTHRSHFWVRDRRPTACGRSRSTSTA